MSNEEDDSGEDKKLKGAEQIMKKDGRGRILSKLRNVGRRVKSRIRRERSISSQSAENNLEREEDSKSEGIRSERAESEFTETPVQTTDTVSSDQELVILY